MEQVRHPLFLLALPLAAVFSLTYFSVARAQITPDNSLGAENSVVAPNVEIKGIPSDRIDGGAIRGDNLFHSFQEFNINAGRGAYFSNPAGIANILTRVTGGNVSNIQGILGVLGNANLFLINPNGILFGPNARLDVGGSFLGSTANSLLFKNGFEFSATNPQAPPLLTITAPVGLSYRENFKNITNQSQAVDDSNNVVGLTVPQGNSLALVGGNVNLDGGRLRALGGRVELGGLSAAGTVGLNSDGSLSFPLDIQRSDISLINSASINVSDKGAGSVVLTGRNIDILGGNISAGVGKGLTADNSSRGDITLNAIGKVTINYPSRVTNIVDERATGNAGNINIKAGDISITNKASTPTDFELPPALDTSPLARGPSGNISLEATTGSISLIGQDARSGDRVISTYGGVPQSGNISLKANNSISLDNAFLVAGSFAGNGGNISLFANEFISLVNNSAIVNPAFFSRGGNSGNITIQSSGPIYLQHTLLNTAYGISYGRTYPILGNAGDINISGQSIFITDGTEVLATSFNSGNSGKIVINGTDQVEISGIEPLTYNHRGSDRTGDFEYTIVTTASTQLTGSNAGDITINTRSLRIDEGAVTATTEGKFGGGNININASAVDLTNNGQISVSSLGAGSAGLLTVTANSIKLDNRASINANTTAGQGNIILNSDDVILRRNSNITTNATGRADGGNITINTDNLVALGNSKITANAQQGYGGNIFITTTGGRFLSPDSVISATSEAGPQFSGTVQFNTPETDPTQGLFELSETVIDPAQQVALNPCVKGFGSTFTVTGCGGLPTDPNKILSSDNVRVDLIKPVPSTVSSTNATQKQPSQKPPVKQIIPAQGWIYNDKGQVVLVGYDPTKTGPQREQPAPTSSCAATK
ncbi:MAG: filamentous hemagglutinin N-terminal domain-containing protein [Brasilonema octagenarum HA4186-MV1]|jgi:filamentous hemagglutinin family protein|nr:filamentous hemagglutinin N-terminal domain-containing protein [Brasilonema octagenarum HA4186-MV1]